ncbi:hypothetical protein DL96DRAFT_1686421 [Flagelloscypha sp. PMI_526]|nr:hypothetical protein DL96DRAFT_1686421 [Flagelloscypha sp. PMI_526]
MGDELEMGCPYKSANMRTLRWGTVENHRVAYQIAIWDEQQGPNVKLLGSTFRASRAEGRENIGQGFFLAVFAGQVFWEESWIKIYDEVMDGENNVTTGQTNIDMNATVASVTPNGNSGTNNANKKQETLFSLTLSLLSRDPSSSAAKLNTEELT